LVEIPAPVLAGGSLRPQRHQREGDEIGEGTSEVPRMLIARELGC
jgi:hypothetical protein